MSYVDDVNKNYVDFEVRKDEFGYYVAAYRITGGVRMRYDTNDTISALIKFKPNEFADFIVDIYGSEPISKNHKMHFQDYNKAKACCRGLREIIAKAIETNNLFLAN